MKTEHCINCGIPKCACARGRESARLAAPEALPEAAPVAIYQVQTGDCWLDMTREQYDNHSKTRPTRIVYTAAPASEPIARDVPQATIDELADTHLYVAYDTRHSGTPSAIVEGYSAFALAILEAAREGKS